jgi:hypothetical protein
VYAALSSLKSGPVMYGCLCQASERGYSADC